MTSVYDLKPRFQALLRPLLNLLVRLNVTPNSITLAALAGSAAVGLSIFYYRESKGILLVLPAWLFLRMALNALDGMMARDYHLETDLGAFLNEVGDILSDTLLYLPLALLDTSALWFIVAFCFGAVFTEFCGVLGQAAGAGRQYQGPMGKSDRAFVVGLLALLTVIFPVLLIYWKWVFLGACLLTGVTCLNRVSGALKQLRNHRQKKGNTPIPGNENNDA